MCISRLNLGKECLDTWTKGPENLVYKYAWSTISICSPLGPNFTVLFVMNVFLAIRRN